MLNFEKRQGPAFAEGEAPEYPRAEVPTWYRDAKLGIFIHWGLYSVPAWATVGDGTQVPVEDAYAHHKYAEWYGNTVRIAGSPTHTRHEEKYGVGHSYEDFADVWNLGDFDTSEFVRSLGETGAKYVVLTTKHHDGFCLWDTPTTGFNSAARGPRRDIVQEVHGATRALGLKFGTYFSGALDWHASNFPAIESDVDLFRFRRNDPRFAQFSAAQLEELVERFEPDVLWNDIEWPDAGKGSDSYGLAALLTRYFDRVPEGVINDRWGIPYHGFLTREYTNVDDILETPWESTRGLGLSFGYNSAESADLTLTGVELIHQLIDVVSKNGNLLINVGPRADGTIPELQRRTLAELGDWMGLNARAIHGTRPWLRAGDAGERGTAPVAYTQGEGTLYLHALQPEQAAVRLPEEIRPGSRAAWLTKDGDASGLVAVGDSGLVEIPHSLRSAPAAVLEVVRESR
ncbi:alpha-L-fucosidase [Pseudactinotalea sp. Z1739]|uniref:alpha-L-fucosidase n=1 Tax=Pseudactinotalea sp. Z1739 TaxID=3413028 RepID=UPI003C7C1A0E